MNNKQFIYVLKTQPFYQVESNWTPKEEAIISRHFCYLQNMLAQGKLILAGKTDGLDEHTFGIVIFEATSIDEANSIMQNDPAVLEGIMTAVLFPYKVALIKK